MLRYGGSTIAAGVITEVCGISTLLKDGGEFHIAFGFYV